jgi:hypothetical protein
LLRQKRDSLKAKLASVPSSRISSPAAATLTAAAIIPKLALYNPQALCRGDESLVPRSEIRNLNSKIACLPRHPVC